MFYAIVTSDNDFVRECYGTLRLGEKFRNFTELFNVSYGTEQLWAAPPCDTNLVRCRWKFVAPGKFFPPPYCHNVTNANPNPNLNPSPNPNPNLNPTPTPNPKFNPILNLHPNPYCCVWE